MDSKLVVEQMSGRWKIKHPDMRPLADAGQRGWRRPGTTYTWIPREQNKHADRILNAALDAQAGRAARVRQPPPAEPPSPHRPGPPTPRAAGPTAAPRPRWCWSGTASPRTPSTSASPAAWAAATPGSPTRAGRRSGRPPTGWPRWPSEIDVVVASPVRRTRESAEILAERLGTALVDRGRPRRDGVRHLGRDDLRGDPGAPPRRPGRLARLARPARPAAASRSGSWRSGCWPAWTGCWPSTPAGRCSWSATSRRSRCWSRTRSARRWSRSTGWSWRRRR